MNTPSKAQLAAILGAIALLVLLLFARKTGAPESTKKSETAAESNVSMESYIDSIKKTLDKNALALIEEQAVTQSADALDSLSGIWHSLNQPGIEAHYLQKSAEMQQDAKKWNKAGEAYYKASRFAAESYRHYFVDQAVAAYSSSLQLDSSNLDTKVNLGICYVESTPEPMKGIMLLREVVSKDSTNINAQLNLGLFAVQSGQYDKAIERFKKILRLNPEFTEAYLYLGQTYANMGKKKEAIEALEKFKELSKDETVVSEVTQYINQLKNS